MQFYDFGADPARGAFVSKVDTSSSVRQGGRPAVPRMVRPAVAKRSLPALAPQQTQSTADVAIAKMRSDIVALAEQLSAVTKSNNQLVQRAAVTDKAIASLNVMFKRLVGEVGASHKALAEQVKMAALQVQQLTGAKRPIESFRPINAEPPAKFVDQPRGTPEVLTTEPYQPEAQQGEPESTMETPAAEMEVPAEATEFEAFYGEDDEA